MPFLPSGSFSLTVTRKKWPFSAKSCGTCTSNKQEWASECEFNFEFQSIFFIWLHDDLQELQSLIFDKWFRSPSFSTLTWGKILSITTLPLNPPAQALAIPGRFTSSSGVGTYGGLKIWKSEERSNIFHASSRSWDLAMEQSSGQVLVRDR